MRSASLIVLLAFAFTGGCGGGTPKSDDSGPGTTTGTATGAGTGTGTGTATGSTTYVDPDAPIANDDVSAVAEGGVIPIDILANDTDPNDLIDSTTIVIVDEPAFGTIEVAPQGIRYRHDGSEDPTDTFTYTVNDVTGLTSNAATVTMQISPVNDPPDAVDDAVVVIEGGSVNIDVLVNDTDVDDAVDATSVTITQQPQTGVATVLPNGSIDFDQDGTDTAQDMIVYTIRDMTGAVSAPAQVVITVTDVNDAPTAVDDDDYCPPGGMNNLDIADNDIDPDDGLDLASIWITVPPLHGSTVINADGTVDYTHDGSPNYADSFQYTILDNTGVVSNVATVNIEITNYVPPVYVGQYNVWDGPNWTTNPPVYSCQEACALIFGGAYTDYVCSTSNVSVTRTNYSSTWGVGGCGVIADDYSLDQGGGYDCGFANCSTSAYVVDNCSYGSPNHCWYPSFP